MKNEDQKNNAEAAGEKQNNSTTNDIRSRLRKNPNKTKLLYTDDFTEKKNKQKKTTDLPSNSLEIAKNILEELKQDEKSSLFRQPAKRSLENEKDRSIYSSKIAEPRDLGTITKKIKSKKYSLKEFFDDLELCWSNAEKFNDENSEAFANAKYMRELTHKLFKEKNVLDLVFNTKNSVKEENNTLSNPQIEVSDENVKSSTSNNMVGKKRKRAEINNEVEKVRNYNDENYNFNNTNNNTAKNKKRNASKNTLSIKDVKSKLNIKNDVPFLTSISNIPTLFGQKPLDNKFNNKLNNQSHKNHHTSATHFTHKDKNNNTNINKIADLEKYRKIIFEWKEEIKPTVPKKFLIQKTSVNIPNFEEEKKQMNLYDENCNIENVYDLASYKSYLNKTQIQQNEQLKKQKLKYDGIKPNNYSYSTNKTPLDKQIGNYYNNYTNNNIREHKEIGTQNVKKVSTEKDNENLRMKHFIAKQLDKLSDNNIIDVLVYIENIRPNAIKELPNETMYIDMDLFSTETFDKLIEFLKKYN